MGSQENGVKRGSHTLLVPVAAGELIDKITILRLKAARLKEDEALKNVQKELRALEQSFKESGLSQISSELDGLTNKLQTINSELWDVEDELRVCESEKKFDETFISLARSVYQLNDERAATKRCININCGSSFIEEKSYGNQCNTQN